MADTCKICKTETVDKFISFGKIPLGNAFLKNNQFEEEELLDLDIGFCTECKLVQQISPPPTELLKKDYMNYSYVPFGNSLTDNLANMGRSIFKEFNMTKDSFFLDLGSNDGTLLNAVKDQCKVLGIEPAINISQIARDKGVNTITTFFTHEVAENVIKEYGHADAIAVTQVLQHIPDISSFLKDAANILKPNGVLVIEGRYFADTIKKRSYDTIYHEMLYFFTLTSLNNLLKRFGMTVFRAELVDVYGGSLRIYAMKDKPEVSKAVLEILETEKKEGIDTLKTYNEFASDVFKLKAELNNLIKKLNSEGMKIVGYGAPSTSATLLNFSGISKDEIAYVVDDSPLKQGLYTPGTHIPIVNSATLEKEKPDYILLLAWRLKSEIIPKIKKYETGVILPLPTVSIMD